MGGSCQTHRHVHSNPCATGSSKTYYSAGVVRRPARSHMSRSFVRAYGGRTSNGVAKCKTQTKAPGLSRAIRTQVARWLRTRTHVNNSVD